MRIIGTIDHPAYKISVFAWSERYIVKVEAGAFEQSFKFSQEGYSSWKDLKVYFDEEMMEKIRQTFIEMAAGLKDSMARNRSADQ